MLSTRVSRSLGLRVPVISAPMGGVSGGELAAEVSRAGGLGMIGVLSRSPAETITEQAAIPASRGLPFGIGLMAWALHARPELLEATIDAGPALVSVSFGDPGPWVGRLHAAGIPVAVQVSSSQEAAQAEAVGVDLVVAQGSEAGGHTGRVATLPLLQEVLEVAAVPVVAAGGIATPAGLAAVLAAGADGALVGTAFLACPETLLALPGRERVLAAGSEDTVYTRVFDVAQGLAWPWRWHGRALRNDFTDLWHDRTADLAGNEQARAAYDQALRAQDYATAHLYAGQAVGLVRRVRPASEVVAGLADGAEQLLRRRLAEVLPDAPAEQSAE
jgi:nitronate monooxygenase